MRTRIASRSLVVTWTMAFVALISVSTARSAPMGLHVEVPVESPQVEVKAATFDPTIGKTMKIHRDDDGDGIVSFTIQDAWAFSGKWVWRSNAHLSLIDTLATPLSPGMSVDIPVFEVEGRTIFTELEDTVFATGVPSLLEDQTVVVQEGKIAEWPDVHILDGTDADLESIFPPARDKLPGHTGEARVADFFRLTIVPEPSGVALCVVGLACLVLARRVH